MELKPGFHFKPSRFEILDYLRSKILGEISETKRGINELNIYQYEPWELPYRAKMHDSRSRKWHFFTRCANKNGKTKRTTKSGYWKRTGNARVIKYKGKEIGFKRTLVFHEGRTPRGKRTNWIMHEYHDTSSDCENLEKDYVVCEVKRKDKKYVVDKQRDGGEASDITLEIFPPMQTTAQSSFDYSRIEFMSWNDIQQGLCAGSNFSENVNLAVEDHEFVEGLKIYKDLAAQLLAD